MSRAPTSSDRWDGSLVAHEVPFLLFRAYRCQGLQRRNAILTWGLTAPHMCTSSCAAAWCGCKAPALGRHKQLDCVTGHFVSFWKVEQQLAYSCTLEGTRFSVYARPQHVSTLGLMLLATHAGPISRIIFQMRIRRIFRWVSWRGIADLLVSIASGFRNFISVLARGVVCVRCCGTFSGVCHRSSLPERLDSRSLNLQET